MVSIGILSTIVAIALPSVRRRLPSPLLLRLTSVLCLYSGALAFNALHIQSIGSGMGLYHGWFTVNTLTQWMDTLLLGVAAAILARDTSPSHPSGRYALVALFSGLGSLLLTSSADTLPAYIGIEMQSFGLYVLATLHRDSRSATSAGLTYFLLGGLSSSFILLGMALLYHATGLTQLEALYAIGRWTTDSSLPIGFGFIVAGLLFKVAAAPLHHWAPDVYDGSPTAVTLWLTTVPKIGVLLLLLNLLLGEWDRSLPLLHHLLLASALLSLLMGTLAGLVQHRIKRLLAYSTVSHIGFMCLALAIDSEQSVDALLFYLVQYTLTTLDAFLILLAFGTLHPYGRTIQRIDELKGQFLSNPLLSLCFSLCLLSMAGIPPLIGFFSKQMVLSSALEQGLLTMALIGILTSVASAFYYLNIVRLMISEPARGGESLPKGTPFTRVTPIHALLIATLTLALLLFLCHPSLLLNSTRLLTVTLYPH